MGDDKSINYKDEDEAFNDIMDRADFARESTGLSVCASVCCVCACSRVCKLM